MKKSILLIFALVLLIVSCDNSENYERIAGDWECTEWLIEATGENKCKQNVFFSFNRDKTYTSKIGALEESGVYHIANGLLYSTPTGKLEIGVELNILNNDTLQFTMSRSGQKEVLTLLHKK